MVIELLCIPKFYFPVVSPFPQPGIIQAMAKITGDQSKVVMLQNFYTDMEDDQFVRILNLICGFPLVKGRANP